MSTQYTPDPNNNPATIPRPSDGDAPVVSSVNPSIEALADKVAHANKPETDPVASYPLATRSMVRANHVISMQAPPDFIANYWQLETAGNWFENALSGSIAEIDAPLFLPHASTLTQINVYVKGPVADVALPGTRCNVFLRKLEIATGIVTSLASVTDNPPDVASWTTVHPVTINGSFAIDNGTFRYFVGIKGESGANSHVGFRVYGVTTTFSVSVQDPGAS